MAIWGGTVSVGATATYTLLATGTTTYSNATYFFANAGAATVFVGGTPATAGAYPLNTGATLALMMEPGETLYGFVSSGTGDIRVLGITGSR